MMVGYNWLWLVVHQLHNFVRLLNCNHNWCPIGITVTDGLVITAGGPVRLQLISGYINWTFKHYSFSSGHLANHSSNNQDQNGT